VSQDSAQELFRHTIASYFGVSRIEFQLCCLWIRFVSQGVVCFHSVCVDLKQARPRVAKVAQIAYEVAEQITTAYRGRMEEYNDTSVKY
jgi:hypothetical protein